MDGVGDVAGLGRGALEELAAGGDVVEQLAHLDDRPRVPRRRLGVGEVAAAIQHLVGDGFIGRPAEDSGAADAADARQGLSPEAHRADVEQAGVVDELARRVRRERQRHLGRGDAAAVVDHADERPPAVLDLDRDLRRPGVDGVLDELLDDRRRPLDHLAGRDAIDQPRRELADRSGRRGHGSSLSASGEGGHESHEGSRMKRGGVGGSSDGRSQANLPQSSLFTLSPFVPFRGIRGHPSADHSTTSDPAIPSASASSASNFTPCASGRSRE